jgi:hypothetical protein
MGDPTTIEEFKQRWSAEYADWCAIRDEMIDSREAGEGVTAFEVTSEQRRRMKERGEVSVLDGVFARRMINRNVASPGWAR